MICIFGYTALGILCLRMAIPPGFSSPIWLPLGFACASIFIFGPRIAAISTFLGALITNIYHTAALLAPDRMDAALVAISMAMGSTLAVLLASHFVKKFECASRPSSQPLYCEKKTISLLFTLGFCCSLVSSIIGTGSLVLFKVVSANFVLISWAHWWVGDGIGIILIAPVGLMWARYKGPRPLLKLLKYSLPALAALASLTTIFTVSNNILAKSFEFNFHRSSDRLARQIQDDVRHDTDMLMALVGFYKGSDAVEEQEFRDFLNTVFDQNHRMEQIVWIPSGQSPRYKKFYSHTYNLNKLDPLFIKDKIWSNSNVIKNPALGLQLQDRQLMIFPIYKESLFLGLVVGVMNFEKLLASTAQNSDIQNFEIRLQDLATPKSSRWRSNPDVNIEKSLKNGNVLYSYSFPVLDHNWKIDISTTRVDLYRGLPGTMFTNLFFGLVFSFFVMALQLILYLRLKSAENATA
jgi:integral membrane sensor domain MASE1